MIPYLEEIALEELSIDSEGFLQIMAIAQAFPGAMGINTATIIGYRMGGWIGAFLAMLGVTVPGILFAAALFYVASSLYQAVWFKDLLQALKAAVVGIILGMVVNLGRKSWLGWRELLIGLTAVLVFYYLKINPALILLGGGIAGYFLLKPREN